MLTYHPFTRPSCSPFGQPEAVTHTQKVLAHVNCGGAPDAPKFEICEIDIQRGVDALGWFVVWPVGTNKSETWYFAKREDMKNVRIFSGGE